jgi:hypothetical protein
MRMPFFGGDEGGTAVTRWGKPLAGLAAVAMLLSACGGQAPVPTPTPTPTAVAASTPAPAPTDEPMAMPSEVPAGQSTQAGGDDAIPMGPAALHASDPTTASLTGEKPRFVEFFAFW